MTYYSCCDFRKTLKVSLEISCSFQAGFPGKMLTGLPEKPLGSMLCGPREIRTLDLLNAIETRSQLRYGPISSNQFSVASVQ